MKRLGLYVPWAIFAALCLAWTGYWFMAKDAALKALNAQVARANAAGMTASYDNVRAGGFPLRLTLSLRNVRLAPAPKLAFEAASLPVSVNLSNPRHIIVGLADGFSWRTGDGVMHTLTTQRGDMSVRFDGKGALARASLDLEGARVAHGLVSTEIGKLLVHVRPDPRSAADAQITIEAENWRGVTPFSALNDLGPFGHFRAAVVATESASLLSRTPLRTWTGALRIERFDVAYAGATVTGDGLLDLDDAHRPMGTLRLFPQGAPLPLELRARDGFWTVAGLRVAAAKPLYSD